MLRLITVLCYIPQHVAWLNWWACMWVSGPGYHLWLVEASWKEAHPRMGWQMGQQPRQLSSKLDSKSISMLTEARPFARGSRCVLALIRGIQSTP